MGRLVANCKGKKSEGLFDLAQCSGRLLYHTSLFSGQGYCSCPCIQSHIHPRVLWDILPLFFGLSFILTKLKKELKNGNYSKAKSYFLSGLLLLLLFPLRFQIIELIVRGNLEIIK